MREKLATLPLTQLKELAKSQGIKNISGLRKAELIDRLCETAKARAQEAPAEAASVSGMREQRVQRQRDRLQHRSARNVRNMEFVGREQTDMRDLTVRTAASAR